MRQPVQLFDKPKLADWGLWLLFAIIGGASFAGIKFAVQTAEPGVVAAGRLWVGAIVMLMYCYGTGRKMPPILNKADDPDQQMKFGIDQRWYYMILCGIIGYAIPFTIIPIAQLTLPSMMAGVYMSVMPILVVIMAYFFARESLTWRKLLGFLFGTLGILFLIGPAALKSIYSADVKAQLIMLAGVSCYAIFAIINRRSPVMSVRAFAAGMLLCGAIAATPLAFVSGQNWGNISITSILGIIFLGVFPSGVTAIFIIDLNRRFGAGFMVSANYISPIIAILFGIAFFQEPLPATLIIGLCIILAGLALSRSK